MPFRLLLLAMFKLFRMNNDRKFVTTGQPTNPYTPRAQGKVVQKGIKPFTGKLKISKRLFQFTFQGFQAA